MRRCVSSFVLAGACVGALGCSSPDSGTDPADMGSTPDATMSDMRVDMNASGVDANPEVDSGGEDEEMDMAQDLGFDGEFPPPDRLPEIEGLPELLVTRSGYPVTSPSEWERLRRSEVLSILEHYAFGKQPDGFEVPATVEQIASHDDLFGGKATMKLIEVTAGPTPGITIDVLLVIPNGLESPPPVLFGANFFGNHTTIDDPRVPLARGWIPERGEGVEDNAATDASRGSVSTRWPFEQAIDRGYAVATFYHGDVDPDRDDFTDGVHALIDVDEAGEREAFAWGTIAAWSWGARRVIDALVAEPDVDGQRIAMLGHSRNGKVALWTAATDARVGMVVSNMSGCMGAALHRRKQGETLQFLNRLFPHWFAPILREFNGAEEKLPFDQHFLIALAAPRPALIISGIDDGWADPEGEFLGAQAASAAYALYGEETLEDATWPEPEVLLDSPLGYYLTPGGHDIDPVTWLRIMDFADVNL